MTERQDIDDTIDINLRAPSDVARRCLILASLLRLEVVTSSAPEDATEATFDLREWLKAEGLWDTMSESEQEIVHSPFAALQSDQDADIAQLSASFTTIAWTLNLLDSQTEVSDVALTAALDALPEPWDSTKAWVGIQSLRPEDEIASERERADVWSWRLETELARRIARGQKRQEIERAIREVTDDARAAGILPASAERDFAIGGVIVSALPGDDLEERLIRTQAQLRALNWVCGFGADWVSVPLDV